MGRLVAQPFVKLGVSPNTLTLLAVPLSAGAAFSVAVGQFQLGLVLAVPSVLLDFLDGAVARAGKQETAFGNHLEAVVDRFVEGALLVGLAVYYPVLAATALTFSTLVSYIKARVGLVMLADNRDWPGVGDRADRLVLVLLGLWGLAAGYPVLCKISLLVLCLMAGWGAYQRLLHSKNLLLEAENEGRLLSQLVPEKEKLS